MISLVLRHIKRSDHAMYQHCALIVKHGRILAIGVNTGWRHAEEDAIGQCSPATLKGSTLHSFRVNNDDTLRYSRPCRERQDGNMPCHQLIRTSGIKWVVYSDVDGRTIRERIR